MKRIILVFLITLFLFSCGANLKNAYKLAPGMTKNEVIAILGMPAVNDFDRNVEEWHYCNYMGNFIALYFVDGKLIAKTSYSVSELRSQKFARKCRLCKKQSGISVRRKNLPLCARVYGSNCFGFVCFLG